MLFTPLGSPLVNQTGNFSMVRGETINTAMTFALAGTPINLTGYTLEMTIGFPTDVLLSTNNGGISITDAALGEAAIIVPDSQSIGFPVGSFPYDFWLVDSAGNRAPVFTGGFFNVVQNITVAP